MPQYKHLTPEMVASVAADVDREIEEQSQLERVRQWAQDPRNAAQVAHIRSELDRVAPRQPQRQIPAQTPHPAQRPAQSGKLPAVIDMNQRFHSSHLKMKPATPQVESVGDPYVFSPGATVRQR
jgi:hypothetical protein